MRDERRMVTALRRNPWRRASGAGACTAMVLVAAMSATLAARADDGGAPGDWVSRYTTARSVGLGGAFVAAADEPLGSVWNPASLSMMQQNEVYVETARLFEETTMNAVSFGVPASRMPSLGITLLSLGSGSIERTSELNETLGSFTEGDLAVLLSASKALSPRLALGANLKIAHQSIEEFSASGVGFDLGALYDVNPRLRVGLSILNLGGPSLTLRNADEKFPGELRGGARFRYLGGRGAMAVEFDQRSGWGTTFHAGTEVWVHPSLALRLGVADASATGGMGVRLAEGFRLDYGLANHELGLTNRIGLSYRFGGFEARSEASPRVFSPLGSESVTRFDLRSRTKAAPSTWALDIIDSSDRRVRRFGGKGEPPSHVMWDGKNESGLPLADGTYRYRLTVVDAEGREIESAWDAVAIYTGGPQGAVPAVVE